MAEMTYPCYWQKKDNRGQWYWIYRAKNKEEIARTAARATSIEVTAPTAFRRPRIRPPTTSSTPD